MRKWHAKRVQVDTKRRMRWAKSCRAEQLPARRVVPDNRRRYLQTGACRALRVNTQTLKLLAPANRVTWDNTLVEAPLAAPIATTDITHRPPVRRRAQKLEKGGGQVVQTLIWALTG